MWTVNFKGKINNTLEISKRHNARTTLRLMLGYITNIGILIGLVGYGSCVTYLTATDCLVIDKATGCNKVVRKLNLIAYLHIADSLCTSTCV